MFKLLKSNTGMTLVEMIIGICMLAIIGITFAQSFGTVARIFDRATTYKIESSNAAEKIEIQDVNQGAIFNENYAFSFKTNAKTYDISGQLVTNDSTGTETGLTYREFITGTFESFDDTF